MIPSTPSDDRLPAPDEPAQGVESPATVRLEPPPSDDAMGGPRLGESIGRYRLLQTLGEGGWGVVYLAEQSEPVWRRVALKVIKIGMDTKAVIARFEAERQALAMMEHPNIAKVLDAGATDAGRPYFVMELVRGMRITEYCDLNNASTRERLELFTQVCHAIQHAHQKGIIHRDIKPSNILVTVRDGGPVPKVIDFGIAKTVHGRLTDATVFTGLEQFMGTPAYMSPEQAELSALDIDTRSDIYSLGVVLYELLTGRPPFDPKTLAHAGLDEIRRMIREVDPLRPSSRLGTLTPADFTRVANHHGVGTAQLSARLRGDLDWIVMKAMEKQRSRRYETVAALAADIGRYLRNEPVAARPPSAVYRVQKFVTRHKVGVGAASSMALALLAAAVISTWQAVRARQAEQVALGERAEARRTHERAEDLLAFLLGDLRTQLEKVGRLDVLEAVGAKAVAYFSSLNSSDLTDAMLARQARAVTQIGEIRMKQLRYAEATTAFTTAYERTAALTARHPRDTAMLFERGQAEFWIGAVHRASGALEPAKEWLTRYRDTSAEMLAIEPTKEEWRAEVESGLHNLAVLKKDTGDLEGARADFTTKLATLRKMIAAKPGDLRLKYRVTDTESWLGSVAEQQGDFGAALAHFTTEAEGLNELQKADPKDMTWRFERADSLSFQANILALTGRGSEARPRLAEARALLDVLVVHDPANRTWASSSHRLRLKEAALAIAEGNGIEAARLVTSARAGFEEVLAKAPKNLLALRELAVALRMEAEMRPVVRGAVTPDAMERALGLGEEMVRSQPNSDDAISQFAHALVSAAQIADKQSRREASLAYAARAMQVLAPRVDRSNDWHLLDPAVRALALLDQNEQKISLQTRLEKTGYVPLIPWPPVSRLRP